MRDTHRYIVDKKQRRNKNETPFVCIILLCVFCSCARTPAKLPEQTSDSTAETSAVYTPKPDEIRAVWISCYELPDAAQGEEKFRERAEEMFNNVADMKLNTVFVHVRAFADAVYPSKLFPWSKYSCKGSDPGFDPLKVMVECAHRAGLKIHAWINPFRVSSSDNIDSLPQGSPAKSSLARMQLSSSKTEYISTPHQPMSTR